MIHNSDSLHNMSDSVLQKYPQYIWIVLLVFYTVLPTVYTKYDISIRFHDLTHIMT